MRFNLIVFGAFLALAVLCSPATLATSAAQAGSPCSTPNVDASTCGPGKADTGQKAAPDSASKFSLEWGQLGAAVAAIGSLGVAAFGLVESLGKSFAISIHWGKRRHALDWGLPYIGLGIVKRMIGPLSPALAVAYGEDFIDVIAGQYRSDRSSGRAPDTIRQGVRLGLPYLNITHATTVIASVWHMDLKLAERLATALQAPPTDAGAAATPSAEATPPTAAVPILTVDPVQALAGRFATALDARVNAAFDLAEEQYEAWAKSLAGGAAVGMSLLFNYGLGPDTGHWNHPGKFPWLLALIIGAVAVPLGPVAKDVSTSLQNALTAFKAIPSRTT